MLLYGHTHTKAKIRYLYSLKLMTQESMQAFIYKELLEKLTDWPSLVTIDSSLTDTITRKNACTAGSMTANSGVWQGAVLPPHFYSDNVTL